MYLGSETWRHESSEENRLRRSQQTEITSSATNNISGNSVIVMGSLQKQDEDSISLFEVQYLFM